MSTAWFLLFAVLVPIYRLTPGPWRTALLIPVGLGFAASHGAYAVGIAVSITALAALVATEGGRARSAGLALVVLGAHLFAWKILAGEHALAGAAVDRRGLLGYADVVAPAGLSYLTFKAIHVVIEAQRGKVRALRVDELAAYLLFVPTWLAGPLGRIDAFRAELAAPAPLSMPVINRALARVLFGVGKKVLVADWLGRVLQPVLFAPQEHPRGMVWLAVYGVALQLYVDFSAASDVAIGSARLLGFTVPENFDKPLLKPNIAEFWRSWHISLYTFIRDYVFFPIAGYKASRTSMYLGVFASIALFQIWHRVSWSFLLLGLFHGAAVAIWQWVQEQKRRSPRLRRALGHRAAWAPSVALTISVYALGNVLFMAPVDIAVTIYMRLAGL